MERPLRPRLSREPHRLRAPRHPHAVRPGAARLPGEAGEADVILRIAAAISLGMGAALLLAFFWWIGESPISGGNERHLREMKERIAAPAQVTPASFADFVALPHGMPVSRFEALEQRAVSLEGYVK